MKKGIIIIAAAAIALSVTSCQKGNVYVASLEKINLEECDQPVWHDGDMVAAWDDDGQITEIAVTTVEGEADKANINVADSLLTNGVRRFLYPAMASVGDGTVLIPTEQHIGDLSRTMPYYCEQVADGKNLDMKIVGGMIHLFLTTNETLASLQLVTDDSTNFMTGRFNITGYPSCVLNPEDGAVRQVVCNGLETVDFSKGAFVDLVIAPNSYDTFYIVMTTTDGRICTKHLKEGRDIIVSRNSSENIILGGENNILIFE